jgi:replicative DNA helicase
MFLICWMTVKQKCSISPIITLRKIMRILEMLWQRLSTALMNCVLKRKIFQVYPSGFPSLDRVTYGWQPTDLIILAARPSVGKTALALNLARNAALNPIKKTPVAVFSLEMSASQLVQRILSAESEIALEKIARGKLEEYEYQQLHTKGIKRLEQAPIFIDDTAALNIFEFRAKARRLVNKHKVGLIIIDYLQLMSGTGRPRH